MVSQHLKALTKKQRKSIPKVLNAARETLVNGERALVCMAIGTVDKPKLQPVVRALKAEVMLRISPHNTVTNWLAAQGIDITEGLDQIDSVKLSDGISDRLRDYRIRWIDSMIEEFSKRAK